MGNKNTTFKEVVEYLENRKQPYILISNEEDFLRRAQEQNTSGLYTKILFKCVNCGALMERNLACCKASKYLGLCKICGLKKSSDNQRADYEERISLLKEKGYIPLFSAGEVENIKSKVQCIGSCGHTITTSLEAFCRSTTALCLDCARHSHDGENNYNWKGGYENERSKFRKSFAGKNFVKQVLKRDNYACQICGSKIRIVAHHKDGYNWCIEKRADIDNGVTLCEECHKQFHKEYGNGNNTKEQFEEFYNKRTNLN